jgi:hypothetical protein
VVDSDRGILSGPLDLNEPRRARTTYPQVAAAAGLVVEHRASGLVGAVVRIDGTTVTLRDRRGRDCPVRLLPGGFAVEGKAVSLVAPPLAASGPSRTASGSVATIDLRAKVALPSRILVEGIHDAELVEKVWGDDLRAEGVVVERLNGMDHLAEAVLDHEPGPGRRLGVLLDHLVPGSKEARAAAALTSIHVLVTGTPFVDVWQAIRPEVVGLTAWPDIPMGTSWKEGVCRVFGEPEPGVLWRKLLAQVTTYADLEPPLVGAVESLIDFVTAA